MPRKILLDLDEDEEIIVEIKRHPITRYAIIGATVIAVFIILLLLFFAVVSSDALSIGIDDIGFASLFGGLGLLVLIFGFIALIVNDANELIVTNKNIIQILQFSLFSNQTSQLNMSKIQDVSVDTNGIFPSMFGYGVIDIETAGEAANFSFRYAPNPNRVAKKIIEAHEEYMHRYRRPGGQL